MMAHVMFGYAGSRRAWCDVDVSPQTWAFVDATHALLTLRTTSHITPCAVCLQRIHQVIDTELTDAAHTDRRRHATTVQEDEMEHAVANQAVYDSILAKLRTRQHPRFAPVEVFEMLYVDGEPYRVYLDAHGTMRFYGNPVVRRILDASAYTLNDVARGNHSHRDVRRLYIEIGYSVDGFLGLTENAIVHLSLTPPAT